MRVPKSRSSKTFILLFTAPPPRNTPSSRLRSLLPRGGEHGVLRRRGTALPPHRPPLLRPQLRLGGPAALGPGLLQPDGGVHGRSPPARPHAGKSLSSRPQLVRAGRLRGNAERALGDVRPPPNTLARLCVLFFFFLLQKLNFSRRALRPFQSLK